MSFHTVELSNPDFTPPGVHFITVKSAALRRRADLTCYVPPGIKAQRQVHLPVPQAFWQERQRREAFPRGLDVLFAAGHHLIGLPRSSRIAEEHA